jgi:hypothetical protein
MNQYEAADEILTITPSAQNEIAGAIAANNAFGIIRGFTLHIKKLIAMGNLPLVYRCLRVMDKIYSRGNIRLKTAVENIFVFSLESITSVCTSAEKRKIMSRMPISLFTVYINQIYKSGI